jgi:putative ABC transport system permease protein
MSTLIQAARSLRRSPAFTALAVVTLAIGIGANTAVFSVVDAVLLRALPYPEPERLVLLTERSQGDPRSQGSTSFLNYLDWRAQASSFEAMGIYQGWHPSLTGSGAPERLPAAIVTSGVMDALRAVPLMGRPMTPADNDPGAANVVLVSNAFWRTRLSGDALAVGRAITLNGVPFTVIGVLAPEFRAPHELDALVWANNALDPRDTRGSRYLRVLARLTPGVSLDRAASEMATISGRLAAAYPATNAGMEAVVRPLRDTLVGDVQQPLLLLLGAAGLVLLVACGNLSNLLLVRGAGRTREVALRAALGGTRARIAGQLLLEAALVAVAGGVLGSGLAVWTTPALLALGPEAVRTHVPQIDLRIVGFALLAVAVTATLTGLLPAWRASRANLQALLKEGLGSIGSRRSARFRSGVIVAELGIALALLSGAGLLVKSFIRVQQVDAGIRADRVLSLSLNLPGTKYPRDRQAPFFTTLVTQVSALPGVESAAVTSVVPFGGDWDRIVVDVEGQTESRNTDKPEVDRYMVTAGYQLTMGIVLKAGRFLRDGDRFDGPLVCVVDEVFAQRLKPRGSPLGMRLRLAGREEFATVVGVVGHVKHYGLEATSGGQVYMSVTQYPWRWMHLVVRTQGDPLALAPSARAVVQTLDPDQPVFGVTTVGALMAERTAARRFLLTLLSGFAAVTLGLAGLGLYSVLAYAVSQRTREIGIRVALGADAARVVRMVVQQGAVLVGLGLAVGLASALALQGVLGRLLFQVEATDPTVFVMVGSLLAVVALVASWLPARRAARVDPMLALRYE